MQSCERKSSNSIVHADVESLQIENQMSANNSNVSNPDLDEIWLSELEEIDMLADITQILSAVRLGLLEDHFRRQRSDLRLRGGGGNRDDTEDDALSTAASETQLRVLLKKIEAIESKVRLLLTKASYQSESATENRSAPRQTDALYEKIEVYKAKLAKCEAKKKKLERSMKKSEKSVESMNNSSKLLQELTSSNVGNTHRRAHKISLVNFSLEENAFSDVQAIIVRKIENNGSDHTLKLISSHGATIGEDQMCQKMYQARFKNFSLKNMGFIYNRFRTYEYYKSGVLDYIETRLSDTETRLDVRLNFAMGKYHYNAAEVRFKRMDNLLRSHMIYYSFRTGQQLADRIVSETWKMWFPKRFYMPYDYFVDNNKKTNVPKVGGRSPKYASIFDTKIHRYPEMWYSAHIFRPICIPIPPEATKEIMLPNYSMTSYGECSFHTVEFFHMLGRYCFGAKDVTLAVKKNKKKFDNYWIDVVLQGAVQAMGSAAYPRIMALGEYLRTGDPKTYKKFNETKNLFGKPDGWSSDLVQGFNVKKLDEIKMSDSQFKEMYEKWGKIHERWTKVRKLRSDRTPYY